ncbi:hypothetical protein SAMN05421833_12983 [Microbispora rosea]|uniref:Uncharacterized protein n=1 Tax=Microbispora rosea TaxID=58117 RepID=A0A1N7GJ34_9ACTN|nr:hypothetical protein [Microbispora rosea]GIH51676.1 hypothetical protein Mro03_68550 [Microbispora rosea subsp. rosea]SIS12542.1 hypothetical protein SAMN05421833_12983 [Microbispora rosea]
MAQGSDRPDQETDEQWLQSLNSRSENLAPVRERGLNERILRALARSSQGRELLKDFRRLNPDMEHFFVFDEDPGPASQDDLFGDLTLLPRLLSGDKIALLGHGDHAAAAAAELSRVNDALSMRASDEVTASPVIMYIENAEDYAKVRDALETVLAAFDQEIILESRQVRGSVWQSFVTVFKKKATPDQFENAADTLMAAAAQRLYAAPQAQISKDQSEAIAKLITSLEGSANALVTFSNLLLIKVDGTVLVRELSPAQAEFIKMNPHLQFNPKEALAALDNAFVSVQSGGQGDGQQAITP